MKLDNIYPRDKMKISNRFLLDSSSPLTAFVFAIFGLYLTWTELCVLKVRSDDDINKNSITEVDEYEYDTVNGMPIVPKCCYLGYGFTFENKSTCVPTGSEFLPEFEDRPEYSDKAATLPVFARYEYYLGDPCIDGKYLLDAEIYSYDKYTVYSNGTLLYMNDFYSKEEFCMETLNDTVRVFICFGIYKNVFKRDFKFTLYAIGLLISVPFLLGTALVYLSIDILRDLRGKSLSCHVICLAIGYIVLALVQLASDELHEDVCIAAGFTIQFFFVAAFFWLNIICFETWRWIKNDFYCVYKPVNHGSDKVYFCYYFIYGFYGPVILSIVSLIMDFEPAIPESYLKPNFGFQSCWFYSEDAALPYFYAPVGITILINVIFFVLSIRKIHMVYKKRALEEQQVGGNGENNNSDKLHSVNIYIKTLKESIYLFCLMGINWTAEIISWAIGGSDMIWLVTDVFNTLQGVVIFYLFVIRPVNVRNHVKHHTRKLWKKLITCDCSYRDDSTDQVTRHWHTHGNETAETDFTSENNKFIESPAPV